MPSLLVKLMLLVALCGFGFSKEMIYFMPYEQKSALKSLLNSIDLAKNNISISIYSFTNQQIAKALKNAAKRGVKIRIIYDYQSNESNPHSTIGYLSKYNNIKTCLLQGKRSKNNKYNGIMHQKVAIMDNDTIFIGSANWSRNAFENNYEVLLKNNDTDVIRKAKSYFEKMFSQCKPY